MLRKLRFSQKKWFSYNKNKCNGETKYQNCSFTGFFMFKRDGLLQCLLQFKRRNLNFQNTKCGMDMLLYNISEKNVNYITMLKR